MELKIGCHVSSAGGIWNAPKNAADLGCEIFQIFTRPPMGGKALPIDDLTIERFKIEMQKYGFSTFVVHTPYFINFGSSSSRIFYGSISVVREELGRASLLGAKYVMTHLGSFKDLGKKDGMKQVKEGLKKVLDGYSGSSKFLIEIAAGAGEIIGDIFEELAEIMEPIKKHKGFGGICFDTQHAWASGYDITKTDWIKEFSKIIGLKWLKMSHINDSKEALGSHKDRHEHIGDGKIGKQGFQAFLSYLNNLSTRRSGGALLSSKGETNKVAYGCFPLILETKADKIKADIKILKAIRDKISPG